MTLPFRSIVSVLSVLGYLAASSYAGIRQGLEWYFALAISLGVMLLVIAVDRMHNIGRSSVLLGIIVGASLVLALTYLS